MIVWIVVADERDAVIFDVARAKAPLRTVQKLENPAAQMLDRDLETDRPGRGFSSANGQRHSLDGERSSRRYSQTEFAKRIAAVVEQARHAHKFDRLVLLAGPRMLGLIREELSDASLALIVAEVAKDIVHLDEDAIRGFVPSEVFRGVAIRP